MAATRPRLPPQAFLDQGNDSFVMGLVQRPGHDSKYNVLMSHGLFAKNQQHRRSPALRPLALDSASVYPRVVSEGNFAGNDSYFCVNEDERFALLLPHVGAGSDGHNNANRSENAGEQRGKDLVAQFMRSACTATDFAEHLANQPPLGNFKLCVSDGSMVIFFAAVDKQAFHLREGIWSFDAYHAGPLRHPSYVEVYFRSSLAIWQQLKGPFLSTFLQQLCLTLYKSSHKALQAAKAAAAVDDGDGSSAVAGVGTASPTSEATAATAPAASVVATAIHTSGTTAAVAATGSAAAVAAAGDRSCSKSDRRVSHSFVSCTAVSLKAGGGEVLQVHADLPNFNSFAFTATTPAVLRADGFGGFGAGATAGCGSGGDARTGHEFVKPKIPKKYISAFNYFSRFFRGAVKEVGVKVPGAKLNEVISGVWRSLHAASMRPLDALAEQSKRQYLRDVDQLRTETGGALVLGVKRPKLKGPRTPPRQVRSQGEVHKEQQQQKQLRRLLQLLQPQQQADEHAEDTHTALPQQRQWQQQAQVQSSIVKDDDAWPWPLPAKHKRHDPVIIDWDADANVEHLDGGLRKKPRAPSPQIPSGCTNNIIAFADEASGGGSSSSSCSTAAGTAFSAASLLPDIWKHEASTDDHDGNDEDWLGGGGVGVLDPTDTADAAALAELNICLPPVPGVDDDALGPVIGAVSQEFPAAGMAAPALCPRPTWHSVVDVFTAVR